MLSKLKLNIAFVIVAVSLAAITAPYTNMFGKHYNNRLDYTCCKGDQLYIHHYYTTQFFWVDVNKGYTVEAIGKPTPNGCNIQCND